MVICVYLRAVSTKIYLLCSFDHSMSCHALRSPILLATHWQLVPMLVDQLRD